MEWIALWPAVTAAVWQPCYVANLRRLIFAPDQAKARRGVLNGVLNGDYEQGRWRLASLLHGCCLYNLGSRGMILFEQHTTLVIFQVREQLFAGYEMGTVGF